MAECSLLALSGHAARANECPLSGVKRTWQLHCGMSAYDPKRTCRATPTIYFGGPQALPPNTSDKVRCTALVSLGGGNEAA